MTDFEAPDQFVEGPQTFKMTVKNIGNVAGDFHGVIRYNEGGDDYLRNPPVGYELTKTVDASEEAIVAVEYDHEPGTRYKSMPFSGIAEV